MLEQLKAIVEGLTFPSEADYPFEVFELDHMPKGKILDFDQFIDSLIVTQEWDDATEVADKRKFEQLRQLLKAQTTIQVVVHAGDTYYFAGALGLTWVGVKAKAVET